MAQAPQINRYGWVLAGAATALVLLLGRLVLADPVAGVESLLRDWIVAGGPTTQPGWAMALEILASLAVVGVAAAVLPRIPRATGTTIALTLIAALLALEITLLLTLAVWPRLLLPVLALLAGLVVAWCFPVASSPVRPAPRGKFTNVSGENLVLMARNLQRQGQLDLAFETYRRCPPNTEVLDALHGIALEFARQRQGPKAQEVFRYLADKDAKYRAFANRPPPAGTVPTLRPLPATAGGIEKAASRPQAAPTAKQTLGRYEIERELGQGAMGTVYLGRDPKINRVVAIKAISLAREFEDADLEEVKTRFFREAEMAGRLNHPGIVTVYDAGEDQGLAYIAMEYLKGRHLSHFAAAEHLLPAATVLGLMARVAEALHYAHRQNVVHRDIKPANIMYDTDTDELKITDFGIARLTDTSRTKTGIVLGTPSFMSPEQLEGGTLDGRTDLFALGVSLYHLLAGQLPFRAGSMTQLMQKIASEPHVPLRSIRPELPECIESILARALAKSPEDRYQTGGEFAASLRTCAQGMPR